MERDIFCELFNKYFGDVFDEIFDIIETGDNKDDYIIQYFNETVLIYDTCTDLYISWYKLTHVGRGLVTNIKCIEDMDTFLQILKDSVIE